MLLDMWIPNKSKHTDIEFDIIWFFSHAFLIARSKWNSAVVDNECLCRVSEILDWEAGGRTEPKHLDRIFKREQQDGSCKVMVIMRRVSHGMHCTYI